MSSYIVSVPWKGRLTMEGDPTESAARNMMSDDGWEITPWWHLRRWIGHSMRSWTWDAGSIGGYSDGEWKYQTYRQRAQEVLREMCDVRH